MSHHDKNLQHAKPPPSPVSSCLSNALKFPFHSLSDGYKVSIRAVNFGQMNQIISSIPCLLLECDCAYEMRRRVRVT